MNRLVMWSHEANRHDEFRMAAEGALETIPGDEKWFLDYFDNPSSAINALLRARGLIAELCPRIHFQSRRSAEAIIEQANIRRLPTAIISDSPDAMELVVPKNGGILIPLHGSDVLVMVADWITTLAASDQ